MHVHEPHFDKHSRHVGCSLCILQHDLFLGFGMNLLHLLHLPMRHVLGGVREKLERGFIVLITLSVILILVNFSEPRQGGFPGYLNTRDSQTFIGLSKL